ncbi:hypothetical protein CCHR01_19429 [Colletotrichum chrysophilum]|uniref:Uncharacterized protein n=1 Tax=Colletotrichum chrysophilum TaxID=1836956 RepID=A0AAD9EAF1_9PEZI|nr:hypothetical protein CCHR01_19429 [Colletotrichum chrysophilum]
MSRDIGKQQVAKGYVEVCQRCFCFIRSRASSGAAEVLQPVAAPASRSEKASPTRATTNFAIHAAAVARVTRRQEAEAPPSRLPQSRSQTPKSPRFRSCGSPRCAVMRLDLRKPRNPSIQPRPLQCDRRVGMNDVSLGRRGRLKYELQADSFSLFLYQEGASPQIRGLSSRRPEGTHPSLQINLSGTSRR